MCLSDIERIYCEQNVKGLTDWKKAREAPWELTLWARLVQQTCDVLPSELRVNDSVWESWNEFQMKENKQNWPNDSMHVISKELKWRHWSDSTAIGMTIPWQSVKIVYSVVSFTMLGNVGIGVWYNFDIYWVLYLHNRKRWAQFKRK